MKNLNKIENKKVLFVCMFGQSRSKWFANRCIQENIDAKYCGWFQEADIVLNEELTLWADVIVILDDNWIKSKKGNLSRYI